ncbi:MAG TPA: hypothetical protein VHC18_07480 [Amycolatopsis sp.]|nr:hypothetical protein [Amycolatopsis sp.]
MPRIGVTGHANLTAGTSALVADEIRGLLRPGPDLVGVTCLAPGADQVFARVVLGLGGRIEVILPAGDYREAVITPDDVAEFDDLLGRASSVRTMPYGTSDGEAYMAASEVVLSRSERVLAVWDGAPSAGYGGTADVVAEARRRHLPVTVVWPAGAERVTRAAEPQMPRRR